MSKLDLNDPQVWDKWRSMYNELSFEEHQDFANACAERFPHQAHHNDELWLKLFNQFFKAEYNVIEVGGWKGELAQKLLSSFKCRTWINYEFCFEAVKNSVFYNPRYIPNLTGSFDWFKNKRNIDADVFLSAHTIEHFSDEHFIQLMKWAQGIPLILLEAPIGNKDSDWAGYMGTHILKMGWDRIGNMMAHLGYEIVSVGDMHRAYRLVAHE